MKEDKTPQRKRLKTSTIRALCAFTVFVLVGIGLAFSTGTGTLSSFGWNEVAAICPLGSLEAMLGSKAFILRAAIAFLGIAILILLVGKAFCSWVCPVPHFQNLFKSKKRKDEEAAERSAAAETSLQRWKNNEEVKHTDLDSRHAVLGGALLSTAIFGFPVFCLVCPVGLLFATFIMFWRLVQFNEVTLGLLIFPLILIVELLVFRKWCGVICPLGALMSLISKANKTLRPHVNTESCLRKDGTSCIACASTCPEHIDPVANLGEKPISECIRCKGCSDICPVGAITFPFLANKKDEEKA